jgi:hypothetical protein
LNQQNSTGQTQPPYPVAGIRSATQNQKRPIQQTKRFLIIKFSLFFYLLFFS